MLAKVNEAEILMWNSHEPRIKKDSDSLTHQPIIQLCLISAPWAGAGVLLSENSGPCPGQCRAWLTLNQCTNLPNWLCRLVIAQGFLKSRCFRNWLSPCGTSVCGAVLTRLFKPFLARKAQLSTRCLLKKPSIARRTHPHLLSQWAFIPL